MPRANIDLGWLAGLFTQTPTTGTSQNPAFQASNVGSYTDPVTGNSSQVSYEDKQGGYVDPASVQKYGTTQPYIPPTNWQRAIHPEQSQYIDRLNNQYGSAPLMAQQAHDVRNTIGSQDASLMAGTLPPALQDLSPTQQYLATGGDFRPTAVSPEGRTLLNNQSNVPGILSSGDVASAQNEANYQQRLLANNNSGALADSQSYENRIQAIKNVGLYNRGYPEQQVKNVMTQEGQITPEEQALQLRSLDFQKQLADQRLALAPYSLQQMRNEAVGGLYSSNQLPVGPPIINRVNPDGTVSQLARNPGGMNPSLMTMQSIKDGMSSPMNGGYKPIGTTSSGLRAVLPDYNTVDPLTRSVINSTGSSPSITTTPSKEGNVETKPTPIEHLQEESKFLQTGNVQDLQSFDATHLKNVLKSIDDHVNAIDSARDFGRNGRAVWDVYSENEAKLAAKKQLLLARDAITTKLGIK